MPVFVKLDCSFPEDPKVIGAGPLAELLYVRAMLHCREHLTDGVIDRRLLGRIGHGIPKPERHAARLVEVGLWVEHEAGYAIPSHVWLAWNPTRAEVDDIVAAKGAAGSVGNHRRWHVARGITDPECRYCIAPRSHSATHVRSHPNRKRSPESEGEGEIEIRQSSSSTEPPRGIHAEPDDDDLTLRKVDDAIAVLVDRAEQQHKADGVKIGHRSRWRATVTADVRHTHGPALLELARARPDLEPRQIVSALDHPSRPAHRAEPAPTVDLEHARNGLRSVRAEHGL